jgi:hypothetical protein
MYLCVANQEANKFLLIISVISQMKVSGTPLRQATVLDMGQLPQPCWFNKLSIDVLNKSQ